MAPYGPMAAYSSSHHRGFSSPTAMAKCRMVSSEASEQYCWSRTGSPIISRTRAISSSVMDSMALKTWSVTPCPPSDDRRGSIPGARLAGQQGAPCPLPRADTAGRPPLRSASICQLFAVCPSDDGLLGARMCDRLLRTREKPEKPRHRLGAGPGFCRVLRPYALGCPPDLVRVRNGDLSEFQVDQCRVSLASGDIGVVRTSRDGVTGKLTLTARPAG